MAHTDTQEINQRFSFCWKVPSFLHQANSNFKGCLGISFPGLTYFSMGAVSYDVLWERPWCTLLSCSGHPGLGHLFACLSYFIFEFSKSVTGFCVPLVPMVPGHTASKNEELEQTEWWAAGPRWRSKSVKLQRGKGTWLVWPRVSKSRGFYELFGGTSLSNQGVMSHANQGFGHRSVHLLG